MRASRGFTLIELMV
ncbi:hypothetical protein CW299_23225, partial [Pseudomonas aeruginosa]